MRPPKFTPLTRTDPDKPIVLFIHDLTGFSFVYKRFAEKMQGCNVIGVNQSDCDYKSGVLSIQEMGKIYANEIIKQYPMPESAHYNILGYSLGGILGMEIAHEFKKKKKKLGFVALIDTPPLFLLNALAIEKYIDLLNGLAKNIFKIDPWSHNFFTDDFLEDRISLTHCFISRCEAALVNETDTKEKSQNFSFFGKIAHNLLMELILKQSDYSNINPKKVFVFSTKKTADDFGLSEDLGWSQLLGKEFDKKNSVIVLPDSCNHFNIFSNENFFSYIKDFLFDQFAEIKLGELSKLICQIISPLAKDKQHSALERFFQKAGKAVDRENNYSSFWSLNDSTHADSKISPPKIYGNSV